MKQVFKNLKINGMGGMKTRRVAWGGMRHYMETGPILFGEDGLMLPMLPMPSVFKLFRKGGGYTAPNPPKSRSR
jgi:hypothetical protein